MKRRAWILGLVVLGGRGLVPVPPGAAVREQAGQRGPRHRQRLDRAGRGRRAGEHPERAVPLGRPRDEGHGGGARARRRQPGAAPDRLRDVQRSRCPRLPDRGPGRRGQRNRYQGRLSRAREAQGQRGRPELRDPGRHRPHQVPRGHDLVRTASTSTSPRRRSPRLPEQEKVMSLARAVSLSVAVLALAQGIAQGSGPGRAGRHQVHDQGREHLEG